MKIALIGPGIIPIPPNGYGAVEKHIYNLAQQLTKLGHQVDILNELHGEYGWAVRVGKPIREGHYDILHAHTSFMGAFLGRVARVPNLVYTSHSPLWFIRDLGPKEQWGMMWERQAVNYATDVIALTKMHRREIMKALLWEGVEVVQHGIWTIPNGVDVERFKPNGDRNGNRVCMLGKIIPRKRCHVAAAAAYKAGAEFHLIGPAPDKDYLKRVKLENPDTTVHEGIPEDELIWLLAHMDMLVHASEAEAMSLALLEAMACGLPIIYASEYADIVKGAGIPIEQNDQPRAYADAIGQLMASEAQRTTLGQKARSVAEQNYAWDVVAKQVEEVYAALDNKPS